MRTIWSIYRSHRAADRGLTLIELLVTLAVIILIMALAAPLFSNVLAGAQGSASTAQRQAVSSFMERYGAPGGVYTTAPGTGTDDGYLVAYADRNGNGAQDPDEPTLARISMDAYTDWQQWTSGGGSGTDPLTVTYSNTMVSVVDPGPNGTVVLSPTITGSTVNGAPGRPYFYVEGVDFMDGLSLDDTTGAVTAWVRGDSWSLPAARAEGGAYAGCAITPTKTVFCWGSSGPLTPGGATVSLQPGPVPGLTGVIELASDDNHRCALREAGDVWCWGLSDYGALGYEADARFEAPAPVPGITNAVDISSSFYGSCAVLDTGSIKCWGYGREGQLGNGALADSATPVIVTGISNAVAVDGGFNHTCALLADTKVKCWGAGSTLVPSYVLTSTSQAMTGFSSITVGQGFGCGIRSGDVWCWGSNTSGRLGLGGGTPPTGNEAAKVVALSSVVEIADGNGFACARQSSGIVKCWGDNSTNAGWSDSTSDAISTPTLTRAGTLPVTSIGSGRETVYLVPADSSVRALGNETLWGNRGPAQLWSEGTGNGFARIWRTGTNVPATTVTFDVVAEDYDTSAPLGRWTVTITIGG